MMRSLQLNPDWVLYLLPQVAEVAMQVMVRDIPLQRLQDLARPIVQETSFFTWVDLNCRTGHYPVIYPEQIPAGATFSKFTPPANTGLGFIELVSDQDILAMADPDDSDGDGISGVPNWNTIPAYVTIPADAISRNGKYICRFRKESINL